MKPHGVTLATPHFWDLHRHRSNAGLNLSLRVLATQHDPRMPLLIPLIPIGRQEFRHLYFERLGNELLGACPN